MWGKSEKSETRTVDGVIEPSCQYSNMRPKSRQHQMASSVVKGLVNLINQNIIN